MDRVRFFLLVLVFVFLPRVHLWAGVTCTGEACTILPNSVQAQIRQLDQTIQFQYTDKVLESMTEAAVITNLNSSLMGPGIVNRFQVGGGVGISAQQKSNIDVVSGDINLRNLPNVGAAIAPNLVAAINLGWFLGGGPSDTEPELKTFLHRFNLYLHGFSFNYGSSNVQGLVERANSNLTLGGDITSGGFTLRYNLVENYSDGFGIFEFAGVSLGLGLHYQRQTLNLNYNDNKTQTVRLGPATGSWGGATEFDYSSNLTSVPLDLRTGVRMFYFLTFFAGGGTSLNFGKSEISITRSGPLNVALDSNAIATSLPSSVAALIPSGAIGQSKTGTLVLDVNGKAQAPNSLGFLVAGFEANVLLTKVTLEAMVSQQIQSVMVGFKITF